MVFMVIGIANCRRGYRMFKCIAFFVFSFLLINVVNAGEMIKEKREVSAFTKIVISGSGHLLLKQGDKEALTIETHQNLLPELQSEVKNKVLYLGPKDTALRFNHAINYHLTVKNIEDIHTEGGIEISSKGSIVANELNISTEGAGKVDLKVKTQKLKIKLAGSGDIILSGTTTDQILKIEGSGKIQGKKLSTKTAEVDISGAGIAEIDASDALDVKIGGTGTVKYYGRPKITQEISGAGEIIPL